MTREQAILFIEENIKRDCTLRADGCIEIKRDLILVRIYPFWIRVFHLGNDPKSYKITQDRYEEFKRDFFTFTQNKKQ